ncbi:MAG TPA: hypothetical protein VGF06_15305 [Terriglobales bacterium]
MNSIPGIRWTFRAAALATGIAQSAVAWNDITPDGISYLDLARAYLRHDWPMTVNAYWGPVYAWLLTAVFGTVKPSPRWEFPLAHLVQCGLLLAAMAAFEYFWSHLLAARRRFHSNPNNEIPDSAMWMLGYSLFIWVATGEVLSLINPDLLLTAEILLLAGMALQIRSQPSTTVTALGNGFVLGIAYLTKAIMFPLAFVFLAVCLSRRSLARVAVSAVIFLTLALPWVVLLSHAKGRLTFSDTGRLNFAWFNYGLPYVHWQGEPAGSGTAIHPTRRLSASPAAFEFNGPLRASYPPWFDPSYWNEGLAPGFGSRKVVPHAARGMLQVFYRLCLPVVWALGMGALFLASDIRTSLRSTSPYLPLLVVTATALALYSLTLVVARYLAPWDLLLWGVILAGLRGRQRLNSVRHRWLVAGVAGALLVTTAANVCRWPSRFGARDNATPDYAIAEELQQLGLRPGDKVASIGYDYQAYWAYLDRLSIVAEIPAGSSCGFWRAAPERQTALMHNLAAAGAKAVIANAGTGVKVAGADPQCARPGAGWRLASGDYVYFLDPQF